MSEFIFDWGENCEKILNGEGYTTSKNQNMEQVALFRYLMDKNYDKEEIFEIWEETGGNILRGVKEDSEEKQFIFEKLFNKALKWTMPPSNPIYIYQEEIDIINSMIVLRWIKEYLLTLLCVYKYYNSEWCQYNDKLRRFCFSVNSQRREWSSLGAKLSDCVKKYKPYDMFIKNGTLMLKMNITKSDGEVVETIPNPSHVQELFHLIKCEKVCKDCGKTFSYSSYTVNSEVCASCEKKRLYKLQYKCHKKQ